MSSDKITNHGEQALELLPGYEQSGTVLPALLSAILASAQDVEDVLDDLLNLRSLDTATGTQLDKLGTILDLERLLGETDVEYRAALRVRYTTLYHSGEPETLIQLYKKITGATQVQLQEIAPATVQLTGYAPEETTAPNARILELMGRAKVAGVNLILQWVTYLMFSLARASETDVGGNGPSDADHGFGSAVNTGGGKLTRVIV